MYPNLAVSLDCFLLVAPSVFSNVIFKGKHFLFLFYHFIQQQCYYEVIIIPTLVIIHCAGPRPTGIVQLILNPNIFINTKVKFPPANYDMFINKNNTSEFLMFVNTVRGYVQTYKCDTIK